MTIGEQHAPLAPSDAARWGSKNGCRGAPAMQRKYPELTDNDEAREGTAAHWYLSEALQGRLHRVGTLAPNGVPLNAEMIENSRDIILDIRQVMTTATPGCVLRIEEHVDAHKTIHPDNDGTPDSYLLDFDKRELFVWDFKYGHRWVDVYQNLQLGNYAIAIFESNGFDPLAQQHEPGSIWGWRITLTVGQPRSYGPGGPVRSWGLGGAALRDVALQLRQAAYEASQPGAELRAGPHCRDCSAIVPCPANQRMGGHCLDVASRPIPSDLSPLEIGRYKTRVTAAIERLKAIDTGLDATAESLIRRGVRIGDGWSLEPTQGRERFTLPPEEIREMILLVTGEDIGVAKTLTPAQARKNPAIDPAVINAYSERPSGAAKLVRAASTDTEKLLGTR